MSKGFPCNEGNPGLCSEHLEPAAGRQSVAFSSYRLFVSYSEATRWYGVISRNSIINFKTTKVQARSPLGTGF